MRYIVDITTVGMMRNAMTKLIGYFLVLTSCAASIVCFVFTLFFIVSTFAAIRQATFVQFIALLSFSIIFAIAGNNLITVAEILNKNPKARVV